MSDDSRESQKSPSDSNGTSSATTTLIALIVFSLAAYFWPVERAGFDPLITPSWLLWTLIAITMFSLGTLVRREELEPLKKRPWWVMLGVATQTSVMPIAAWVVTRVVPMSDEIAAGVILVGCVPGAMASNVLTHSAGGSVAFSVSLTVTSTLLSPFTVPMLLWLLAGKMSETSLWSISLWLTLYVVVPTGLGYLMANRWSTTSSWLSPFSNRFAGPIAIVALLWIIAGVVASNRDLLSQVSLSLIGMLLVINVVGYLMGWAAGKAAGMPTPFARALSLEVGMQNAGLGTALAASLYAGATTATIPTAAYTFGCMLTGTILAAGWRRGG